MGMRLALKPRNAHFPEVWGNDCVLRIPKYSQCIFLFAPQWHHLSLLSPPPTNFLQDLILPAKR